MHIFIPLDLAAKDTSEDPNSVPTLSDNDNESKSISERDDVGGINNNESSAMIAVNRNSHLSDDHPARYI